ncbi:hypothetical protein QE394_001022 [Arthrobacter sp. SORGH_AS 212]|nr:hypothetical protein [Arthrobacter sp. SORGH_AS_0212]
MSVQGWLTVLLGTAFILVVLPYVLAVISLAPNGTETLLLVVLLWAGMWVHGRRRSQQAVTALPRQGRQR